MFLCLAIDAIIYSWDVLLYVMATNQSFLYDDRFIEPAQNRLLADDLGSNPHSKGDQ